MSRERNQVPCTSLYLRAPVTVDRLVEDMSKSERRTKTVVLALAIEQYAERHHPELYREYKAGGE